MSHFDHFLFIIFSGRWEGLMVPFQLFKFDRTQFNIMIHSWNFCFMLLIWYIFHRSFFYFDWTKLIYFSHFVDESKQEGWGHISKGLAATRSGHKYLMEENYTAIINKEIIDDFKYICTQYFLYETNRAP